MKTTLWYIPWGESGQCLYRSFFFNSLANCKLLVCPLRSLVILDLLTRNWGLYLPHTTDDRIIWSYLMLHWFLPCPGNVTGRESQYIRNHYRKVFVEVSPKKSFNFIIFLKNVFCWFVFSVSILFIHFYPFIHFTFARRLQPLIHCTSDPIILELAGWCRRAFLGLRVLWKKKNSQ